jgi:amino acid adenylation domain-containing protein
LRVAGARPIQSLGDAFAAQVLLHPERPALCADIGKSWSYSELAADAWKLAHQLVCLGVERESPVAIVGGRSAETVIAILGVLSAGGAYCVVDPQMPPQRCRQIMEDLVPAVTVVADQDQPNPVDFACPVVRLARAVGYPVLNDHRASDPSALAYVLFTSGSRGRPKGVMVEHGSVLNMLRSYEQLAPSEDGFSGALIAPPGFDVSVWDIFSTIGYGGTLHVPRNHRLMGGDELWDYLSESVIQSAYIPPGLIEPVVAAAERRPGTLRRVLVGVEPIPQGVIQRFREACPGIQVVNGYGPTETTITATLHLVGETADPHRRIPIGRPVAGSRVEILDEYLSPVPSGEVGEIIVFGDCLARGYLKGVSGGFIDIAGTRAYRTGDYGRFLEDGVIEFNGRKDGQFKINGFRLEASEVEAALNSMPGVRRSVVLSAGGSRAKRLVAAVEAPRHILVTDIRKHLAERLPAYAVPSRIVVLQTLPYTANGKVDSDAVLAAGRDRPADAPTYIAPETSWHQEVARAWSAVLGIAEVGIADDFHQLGGNSLDAVRIAAYLSERGHPVLGSSILAARIIRHLKEPTAARIASAVVAPGAYPSNRAQDGLWAWREMNPAATATTVVHTIKLEGTIDHARMERAIRTVVECHEALRTTFKLGSDQKLEQLIASQAEWELSTAKVSSFADIDREIQEWLKYRFDVRVRSWTARLLIGPGFGALIFAADHLVFDGESANILQRDLACSYDGISELNTRVPGPASLASLIAPFPHRRQELCEWWHHTLDQFVDGTILPEPLKRGTLDRQLRRLETRIDDAVWDGIVTVARTAKVSPFVVLLAALKSFRRERGGNPDNTVSIALSRRHAIGCENAIGNFINLIPVRDQLAKSRTASISFTEYLAQISERYRAAIEHGDLPFEDMIAGIIQPPGPIVAAPARVVLVQKVQVETFVTRSGLQFAPWPDQPSNAIYDLAIFVSEATASEPGRLEWVWAPGTTLEHSLEWMADAFSGFLRAAVASPATMLSALPALSPPEAQLVAAMAKPQGQSPETGRETLVSLFEAQVSRRPDAVAVEDAGDLVTYSQLAKRASEIARTMFAESDYRPVIIVLDKSADQLAAMLAALTIASPYLPLDPDHARTRLPDLAVRAGARVCITDSSHAEAIQLPETCRLVLIDRPPQMVTAPELLPSPRGVLADDLAYIMPTSGSTGPPKLVGVPHKAAVRLVHRNFSLPLDETDRTMLIANSSFDAATFEVWGALANGGRVVVPTREQLREPDLLAAAIETHCVTAAFFTTTLFEWLLDAVDRLGKMRHVIVGGEAVPPRLFAIASDVIPRSALVNGYGPTENTTFSCCFRLDRDPRDLRSLPIGRPISGSGAIVVDEAFRPLPPGAPGEILVTGAGLAVGYIDDADLTAQRFVRPLCLKGESAYRTGDFGRLLPDGMFEYMGRIDRQLKIRGFRVEPGEVEAVLSSHPAVRSSVVYADDLGGKRTLLAAVEAVGVDQTDLRRWLADRVPQFLIPTRIYVVDRLPMTANGKLDHSALRDDAKPHPGNPLYQPLGTDLERLVSQIAGQLLGLAVVGRDEDLFDLGANSMAVIALTARLGERIGRSVPNHLVYSARTVRSLAACIEGRSSPADNRAAQRVLARGSLIRKRPSR